MQCPPLADDRLAKCYTHHWHPHPVVAVRYPRFPRRSKAYDGISLVALLIGAVRRLSLPRVLATPILTCGGVAKGLPRQRNVVLVYYSKGALFPHFAKHAVAVAAFGITQARRRGGDLQRTSIHSYLRL